MLKNEPISPLKPRRKNSKNNIQIIKDEYISLCKNGEKIKNEYFKIDLSGKINKKSKNKSRKKSDKNKFCKISYIDIAIINYEQGFYQAALKCAMKALEYENCQGKANYIILLCYLEMYDIDSAEKFLLNSKNKKLKLLLENKKKILITKSNEYKSYPEYINFLRNLYKNNAFFPKVEIKFYTNDYRGVISNNKILKYETIMLIPKDCLITLELVLNTSYGKQIHEIMNHELNSPKHCLLSCFILFEENNPLYKYYFELLPKNYDNFPIFYTQKELEYLYGSPFLNLVINKKIDMQMDYNKLCEKVENFKKFSFEKFCKARCVISSRVFGITIQDIKTDALVPFADLLNHRRPRQTQWFYDDERNAFIVQAIENIEPNMEIFDSYGKKSNARFLLNYGFSIENNETMEYCLTISSAGVVGMGDGGWQWPYSDMKKKFFKNEEFYKSFNLNINFQESQILELICYLRFLTFDENIIFLEKVILTIKNDNFNPELIINHYFFYPINKNNEIKTLEYLKYLCQQALDKYPTNLNQDQQIYEENKNKSDFNFNYKNCLLLVMSEKKVLIYYIDFCDYCLKLLKMKNKRKILETITHDSQENNKIIKYEFYIKEFILKLIDNEGDNNNNNIDEEEEEIKDCNENQEMEEEDF